MPVEMETTTLATSELKVVLKGRLDTAGVDRVETKFVAALVPRGHSAIVDLSEVTFVASMGLRMLISVARTLSRKDARLVLFAPQEGVREVFESVSLGDIISIRDTEGEALAALQAPA
jgi:anti-sigma B factor antagonist